MRVGWLRVLAQLLRQMAKQEITRANISVAASVAGPARCIAILDTSVLCPLLVRDTFLGPIFAICK